MQYSLLYMYWFDECAIVHGLYRFEGWFLWQWETRLCTGSLPRFGRAFGGVSSNSAGKTSHLIDH